MSIDINVSYVNAAKLGERLTISGHVLKTGRKLAFTDVDIKVAGWLATFRSVDFRFFKR